MKPMTILSIFVCLLSVLSCGSDNEETEVAVIDVSPAQLSATHEGLVTSATINSGLEWTAFSDDACKDWISCKITDNGSQGTVEVTVKANTTYQSREGKVVVKAGAARTSIPVTQGSPTGTVGRSGHYRARRIQTGVERRVQQRNSTRSRPMVL